MIKFIQCVRRKPDLDPAEFRGRWQDYLDAIQRVVKLTEVVRMTSSYALAHETNALVQSARGTDDPFDAVLEVWWQVGAPAMQRLAEDDAKEMLQKTRGMLVEIIDVKRSSFFLSDEEVLIEG
ncbi:MAG: hypothetical protein DRJ42_30980 [Deltaproteobacteria bacterium]|nr:MAG: hypothetical protein DRJ42_30980 [Deltaproteobacteria bacterium]